MLALVQPHQGGLLPLSLGLLHPQEIIREYTVDIFNELRQYPVSFPFFPPFLSRLISPSYLTQIGVLFLQSLNHFPRYTYVRLAAARKAKMTKEQSHPYPPAPQPQTAPIFAVKTPSNRSESSLGGS